MTRMVDVSAINMTSIVSHEDPGSKDFFFNIRIVFKNLSTVWVWLMKCNQFSGGSVCDSVLGTSSLHVCVLCSAPECREHFLQRKVSVWVMNIKIHMKMMKHSFKRKNILHELTSSLPADSHHGWGESRAICFIADIEVIAFTLVPPNVKHLLSNLINKRTKTGHYQLFRVVHITKVPFKNQLLLFFSLYCFLARVICE